MKQPSRTILCREGWYYLLVFALVLGGAILRDVNLLLLLAGMLAGPILFSWRAVALNLRGIELRRKTPHGACAGDLLVTHLSVRNTRRRLANWSLAVEEQIQRLSDHSPQTRNGKPLRPTVLFPYVPAGGRQTGAYRGRLMQRGRYRLGPLRVSSAFPFGLIHRRITLDQTEELIVLPRLGQLTVQWTQRRQEAFAGAHRREHRPGQEGDFFGVRPWRDGDRQRWIHWRTSARAGQLVVRQYEQPRNRDLVVLLDLWQPTKAETEHGENVELAVSFAATVIAELCRKGGCDIHLGLADPQPHCSGGPASAALLGDMLRRLAVAESQPGDARAELIRLAAAQSEPGTEIVLIGTRPCALADSEPFAGLWSDPARSALARRILCVDASSDALGDYFHPE